MVDSMSCLRDLLFFDIPLSYFYTNLNSSIMCRLSSGDTYLFFGTSFGQTLPTSISLSRCFDEDFLKTPVILSAILLPIKSPVAAAVFLISLFEAVFIASVVVYCIGCSTIKTFLTVIIA